MPDLARVLSRDLDTLERSRDNILGILDGLTLAQANWVPAGFNNNVVWNAAHCFVTQVLLTEGLGGLGLAGLDENYVATYRKGGQPVGDVSAEELDRITSDLAGGAARLRAVLAEADWSRFTAYATSYGVRCDNVTEAVRFNNVHEGMHIGVMLAQRRLVA